MWEDGGYKLVREHGSPLKLDGLCVCHAFMLVACVPTILEFLFHIHGVGHGHSGFAMEIRMSLCEVCCHGCMIGYMLFMFLYDEYRVVLWL